MPGACRKQGSEPNRPEYRLGNGDEVTERTYDGVHQKKVLYISSSSASRFVHAQLGTVN